MNLHLLSSVNFLPVPKIRTTVAVPDELLEIASLYSTILFKI